MAWSIHFIKTKLLRFRFQTFKLNKMYFKSAFCLLLKLTPDEDFILDRHQKHDNIVIGAGFSGRCRLHLFYNHEDKKYRYLPFENVNKTVPSLYGRKAGSNIFLDQC